jgi:hypothetical protein
MQASEISEPIPCGLRSHAQLWVTAQQKMPVYYAAFGVSGTSAISPAVN